jgi:hypothetical protein
MNDKAWDRKVASDWDRLLRDECRRTDEAWCECYKWSNRALVSMVLALIGWVIVIWKVVVQ